MGTIKPDSDVKIEMDDSGCVQDETSSKLSSEVNVQNVYLMDLSDDVLLYILQFCSPRDLKALGYTCERLYTLIQDHTLWQTVDCSDQPCGPARVLWLLQHGLHAGTKELLLLGYARELSGRCNGKVDFTREEAELAGLGKSESGNDSDSCTDESESVETGRGRRRRHSVHTRDATAQNGDGNSRSWSRRHARYHINATQAPRYGTSRSSERNPDPNPCCLGQHTLAPPLLCRLRALCPALTSLSLHYCVIDCKTTSIGHFPRTLKKLSLRGTKCDNLPIDKAFLYKIHDYLPDLEHLDVSECDWMEPASLLPLSKLPKLRSLAARDCRRMAEFVAYASLATRYGFRGLEVADFRGSPVGDSEVSAFGWLPFLRELYLSPAPNVATPPREHTHYKDDPLVVLGELEHWEMQEPEYFKTHRRQIDPSAEACLDTMMNDLNRETEVRLRHERSTWDPRDARVCCMCPEMQRVDEILNQRALHLSDMLGFAGRPPSYGMPPTSANVGHKRKAVAAICGPEAANDQDAGPSSKQMKNDERNSEKMQVDSDDGNESLDDDDDVRPPNKCVKPNGETNESAEAGPSSKRKKHKDKAEKRRKRKANKDDSAEIPTKKNKTIEKKEDTSEEISKTNEEKDNSNSSDDKSKSDESSQKGKGKAKSSSSNGKNDNIETNDDKSKSDDENGANNKGKGKAKIGDEKPKSSDKNGKSDDSDSSNDDDDLPLKAKQTVNNEASTSTDKPSTSRSDDNANEESVQYVRFRRNRDPIVIRHPNLPDRSLQHEIIIEVEKLRERQNENASNRPSRDNVQRNDDRNRGLDNVDIGPRPLHDVEPRHHVMFVNVGQIGVYRLARAGNSYIRNIFYNPTLPHLDATSLITDSAVRRFGRADGEDLNYVHIGPNGPYPVAPGDPFARPNRSNLRVLSITGFRHITDNSLVHLATAAPHLRVLDFSETNVTAQGVETFKNLRPDCEVKFSPFVQKKDEL